MRWIVSALLASLLPRLACADSGKPSIEETDFKFRPTDLFYFDDSETVIVYDDQGRTAYRSDDGGFKWQVLAGVPQGEVIKVQKHPYDNQYAIALGSEKKHWVTKDQGKSWKEWAMEPTPIPSPMVFHATDPKRVLIRVEECLTVFCEAAIYYTTDGFETAPKKLREGASNCLWAKTIDTFTTGDDDLDKNQILCLVRGPFRPFSQTYKLMSSSDYFVTEVEPAMNDGRAVPDIISLATIKHYIVVAAKSEGTRELAMYVTHDAQQWHRAQFGNHAIEEDGYTLLESTNYSMQVDVLTENGPMGVLLTSNSNGTYFTRNLEHTNRSPRGFVDVEGIQNIQGILLANTVSNWEAVKSATGIIQKKLLSQISFDDGRTWENLKTDKGEQLHVHSITETVNSGRIFSSPAPGIVMGLGNTGEYLDSIALSDLYVSDDAGLTWKYALKGPHLYEIGDQGAVILAVEAADTKEIKWSINHGKDWKTVELSKTVRPVTLTTVPDSTSLKFILSTLIGEGYATFAIDLEGVHEDKCGKSDFEDWFARVDSDGKPTCLMGHTQKFRRRKASSECFVHEEFKDPVPETENCKCTDLDYECDYENGFVYEDGACKLSGLIKPPAGECEGGKKTFKGSSGYRLIPGNTCIKDGGKEKDKLVEYKCDDAQPPPESGLILKNATRFPGENFVEYFYLECTASESCVSRGEEPLLVHNNRNEVYVSMDHGRTWVEFPDEKIVAIYPHTYINGHVYLITASKVVHYSKDHGKTWHSFEAPEEPNRSRLPILSFHPTQNDWLIWTGSRDCQGNDCQTVAHVSQKGGDDWQSLSRSVGKCQFVFRQDRPESDNLVICERHEDENTSNPLELVASTDWFATSTPLKKNVINFATMAEYIVVAIRDTQNDTLQVDTSIDGQNFADAKFPPNFEVNHQQAYTVLDSSTHSVFLHVTTNNKMGQEYGSIIKSNSNGSSYVLAASDVNRNTLGFVDFEKMHGLEGVAITNRVGNKAEVDDKGDEKKLKTYITHNDGADWALVPQPFADNSCSSRQLDKCSLHLHGYTERKNPHDAFSSPNAIGIMIALGNVGEFLTSKSNANTFLTRDAGITWEKAGDGNHMWAFGDQGSILVLVKSDEATKSLRYTLDQGRTWKEYQFADYAMDVSDISTLPSGTSRSFLIWGKYRGELVTISLDFSGMSERSMRCFLDEADPQSEKSDYELWSPSHPASQSECLFGHKAQYHRKKYNRNCYNGGIDTLQALHAVSQNCSCTRLDFECDYNFERQSDGSCALVAGLQPKDPQAICREKPGTIEYYQVTGYRRIPISTCEGGLEMDLTSRSYPCPGKEPEYRKKHGVSGAALFFAIVLPIAAAVGAGHWVWKNWEGRFGRIQLGGDGNGLGGFSGGGGGYGAFDRDAPWIKFPVVVISGVVAVVAAMPMVIGTLWSAVSTRLGRSRASNFSRPYTSRSSFARGRGDYTTVDANDEGELLGIDSDEEI